MRKLTLALTVIRDVVSTIVAIVIGVLLGNLFLRMLNEASTLSVMLGFAGLFGLTVLVVLLALTTKLGKKISDRVSAEYKNFLESL